MKEDSYMGLLGLRVCLKILETHDLEKIYNWKNNFELSNLMKAHPLPIAKYEVEEWFRKNQSDKNQISLGIFFIESKEPIGIVRLMFIDWISSTAEMGIYIGGKEHRGKGIGKEVIKLILNYAFKDINLHKVYLRVLESNLNAIKVYDTCGFVKEGKLRSQFWVNGKYENVLIMGILRDEFQQ